MIARALLLLFILNSCWGWFLDFEWNSADGSVKMTSPLEQIQLNPGKRQGTDRYTFFCDEYLSVSGAFDDQGKICAIWILIQLQKRVIHCSFVQQQLKVKDFGNSSTALGKSYGIPCGHMKILPKAAELEYHVYKINIASRPESSLAVSIRKAHSQTEQTTGVVASVDSDKLEFPRTDEQLANLFRIASSNSTGSPGLLPESWGEADHCQRFRSSSRLPRSSRSVCPKPALNRASSLPIPASHPSILPCYSTRKTADGDGLLFHSVPQCDEQQQQVHRAIQPEKCSCDTWLNNYAESTTHGEWMGPWNFNKTLTWDQCNSTLWESLLNFQFSDMMGYSSRWSRATPYTPLMRDIQTCLKGKRLLVMGDSWARELFIEILLMFFPAPVTANFFATYQDNREIGTCVTLRNLRQVPFDERKHCNPPLYWASYDLKKCGYPPRATVSDGTTVVRFQYKEFPFSPLIDYDIARMVDNYKADVILLYMGRWGLAPLWNLQSVYGMNATFLNWEESLHRFSSILTSTSSRVRSRRARLFWIEDLRRTQFSDSGVRNVSQPHTPLHVPGILRLLPPGSVFFPTAVNPPSCSVLPLNPQSCPPSGHGKAGLFNRMRTIQALSTACEAALLEK